MGSQIRGFLWLSFYLCSLKQTMSGKTERGIVWCITRVPVEVKLPPLLDIKAATTNISPPLHLDEVIPTPVLSPSSDSLMHARWGLISNGKINGRIIALGLALFHTHILVGLQGNTEEEKNLDPFASLGSLLHCDTHTHTHTRDLSPSSFTP